MEKSLQLEFVQSAALAEQLPTGKIELAVLGRSNVGKSSLINALANRKKLAYTSKTPGATKLINIFELQPEGSGRWLVDLPGYGFARTSGSERKRWQLMIEDYLTNRDTLHSVLVLVDGLVGPTDLDLQSVEWLDSIGLDYTAVATKLDKVKPSQRHNRKKQLADKLGVDKADVFWVSASKNLGLDELRKEIVAILSE